MRKTILLGSALTVPLLMTPLGALAQGQAAGADASSSDQSGVQEIIVTAQKREERLVNVPVAITAVSGEGLMQSGVKDMADLSQVVPGLRIDSSGSAFQPSIRGIGTAIVSTGVSPNIAIYLDGIYQPSPYSTNFNFVDVENVQVLKGPQGTLFGRNATGGAILLSTKEPSFDTHLTAGFSYGSFDTFEGRLFATTGITDKIAMSFAIGGDQSDGWIRNIALHERANPSHHLNTRVKLKFDISDAWTATATYAYFNVDDPTLGVSSAWKGYTSVALLSPAPQIISGDTRTVNYRADNKPTHRTSGHSLTLKNVWDLGFAQLSSLTGKQWQKSREIGNLLSASSPVDGTPFAPGVLLPLFPTSADLDNREKTFSQELNLAHQDGGAFDWVAGLFYFKDKYDTDPFKIGLYGQLVPGLPNFNLQTILYSTRVTTASYAAFGDVTYNTGPWHFTLGGRYGYDRIKEGVILPGLPLQTRSDHFHSFTPRAVVRYSLTPRSNIYASYSRGNKAGIYNAGTGFFVQPDPVRPENISSFELGYKTAQRTWRLEASAYYYDYSNLQVAAYNQNQTFVQNAKSAEVYGFDVAYHQLLVPGLTLDLGAAYTHGRYKDFKQAIFQSFSDTLGIVTSNVDASGNRMIRTPTFSGNAGLNWSNDLAGGKLDLNANYSYQTGIYFDFANSQRESGYGLLNLRAAWTDSSDQWTLALSARNVTDEIYLNSLVVAGSSFAQTFGAPRSVKIDLQYRF